MGDDGIPTAESPEAGAFARRFEAIRPDLSSFLRRMVVRVHVAEELLQETALRAWEAIDRAPGEDGFRPWAFRIASNLAIDHLRSHGTFRESTLTDARAHAESDPAWRRVTGGLRGSPEVAAVAREHLACCLACVLRQFDPSRAATLLLREVHGFRTAEIAEILGARPAQVKNWLQEARASMSDRYAASCALIAKQGVCYQCVELDGLFAAGRGDPLAGTPASLDDRLAILRDLRAAPSSRWESLLTGLLDEIGA